MRTVLRFTALLVLAAACDCSERMDATLDDGGRPDVFPVQDGGFDEDAGPRPDAGPCGEESCDDGFDDDCDGVVDEACPCLPGETATCFRGPRSSLGLGLCAAGSMTCEDGLEFGTWGECTGDVLPTEESCEAGSVDEDCDGAVNEGCECTGDEPLPCGSDVGACGMGLQECIDGVRGECVGATDPMPESCNGIDDDCDDAVDETLVRACGSDVGTCTLGNETCVDGSWGTCAGGRGPVAEACDGLDNDCDGAADEDLTQACGSSVGACMPGMQTCSAGAWSACSGETMPMLETCNGIDDDCDGTADETLTRPCGTDVGTCVAGTQTCTAGAWSTACAGSTGPGTEACDGTLDEDCDGAVDEGCGCTTGMTRACGTSTGACTAGTQTCDAAGMWGTCTGAVGPSTEVCNMIDDDCDGMTDEGGVCPTSPPVVTCGAGATAEVLSTVTLNGSGSDPDGGAVTYLWTVTSRPPGSTSTPASPTSATTTFYLDASGTYVLRFCATDDEGEMACCNVTVTSTPPGTIHVELSWSTAYGDADLHFLNVTRTPPDGWWTSDDCYFMNPAPDWGPAGVNANPTLDIDDTSGFGPENTTIDVNPQSGRYTIGVHYYCSHSIGTGGAPGDGPTEATVRVYCAGALIATYTGIMLNETDDWVTVASVDYPSCAGRSINTRTRGIDTLPASFTTARHCEIPCSTNADCPSGERCAEVVGPGGRRRICVLD